MLYVWVLKFKCVYDMFGCESIMENLIVNISNVWRVAFYAGHNLVLSNRSVSNSHIQSLPLTRHITVMCCVQNSMHYKGCHTERFVEFWWCAVDHDVVATLLISPVVAHLLLGDHETQLYCSHKFKFNLDDNEFDD